MPNWCSTNITISGEKPDIDILWKKLNEATSKNYSENDFGTTWLGNIVEFLDQSYKTVRCRGSITYMDRSEDGEIVIDTETAWSVMLEPFTMLIERYAPNAYLIYQAVEPGCCLYLTNDPAVDGTYLLDIWDKSGLPKCFNGHDYSFHDRDELKKLLKEALGRDDDLGKLILMAEEKWGDNLSINRFEYCDAAEL